MFALFKDLWDTYKYYVLVNVTDQNYIDWYKYSLNENIEWEDNAENNICRIAW